MKEIANKEDLAQARATASQIRQGIHNYLATLALIAKANKERHWKVLGYENWQSYVDGEFGAERLRLPAEHRQKAVEELRLAGLSQRAIGTVLGVDQATVHRDLQSGDADASPAEITGTDGKTYAASRPSQPAPPPAEARAGLNEAETVERSPVEAGDGAGVFTGAPAPQTAVEERGRDASTDAPGEEVPFPSVRAGAAGAPTAVAGGRGPGNPLEEVLANDPAVQAADYLAQFTTALSRAGGFMSFDAERVAQLAGTSTWDAIEAHASVVAHWYAKAQTARRGLRVIKGGVA